MNVAEWSALWGAVEGGWLAGDGFAGIAHPADGRYAFLHGDTFWRDSDGGPWTSRNSMTVFDPDRGVVRAVEDETAGANFIPSGDGGWFWHGDMMWDGPDLWVIPIRAASADSGWGFAEVRPRELVQLSWPSFQDPRYVGRYSLPFGSGDVTWGASLVRAWGDQPWVYVYGTRHQPGWFGHDVFCARVRSGYLLEGSYWRFYAGLNDSGAMKWSPHEEDATPIIDHGQGPAGTFSSDMSVGGQVRITSKLHGDFGSQVTMWQSVSPVGPFSTRPVVEVPWTSADQTYGAFAHPGLPSLSNGRKMISVNHNTDKGLAAIVADPALYRPSWHEVLW